MKKILITNNPLVYNKYKDSTEIMFSESWMFLDVLKVSRDKIHIGHELLTHPLSGSIKPNETPYKSLLISYNQIELNMQSLQIIEESIAVTEKFLRDCRTVVKSQKNLEDFQLIDFGLIKDSIERE